MGVSLSLDHVVIAVSDWERSGAFYRDVLGAELLELDKGRFAYRFGAQQLNVHGPGSEPFPIARERVRPGNSDLCFVWPGRIEEAVEHLRRRGVAVEEGPVATRAGVIRAHIVIHTGDADYNGTASTATPTRSSPAASS